MSISSSERVQQYQLQQNLMGQTMFCSMSLWGFDSNTLKPKPFLARKAIKPFLAGLSHKDQLMAASNLLEGHTFGNGKASKILLFSPIHARITADVNSRVFQDDLSATIDKTNYYLMNNWARFRGLFLPYTEIGYSTVIAAWLDLLHCSSVLSGNQENVELLLRSNNDLITQHDSILLEKRTELSCFRRFEGVKFVAEPVESGQIRLDLE